MYHSSGPHSFSSTYSRSRSPQVGLFASHSAIIVLRFVLRLTTKSSVSSLHLQGPVEDSMPPVHEKSLRDRSIFWPKMSRNRRKIPHCYPCGSFEGKRTPILVAGTRWVRFHLFPFS